MFARKALILAASLSLAGTTLPVPAAADGGSAFVGGLVGGMLGTAIGNAQQKRYVVRKPAPSRGTTSTANAWQREENRRVQSALNYFGFEAGVVDGVMGRNSRAAIGRYQAHLGYPATGALTEYEKVFLTSSWERARAGGAMTAEQMARYGAGPRGLLLAWRDERMGTPPPVVQVAPAPAPAEPAPAEPVEAEATVTAAARSTDTGAARDGLVPSFLPGPAASSVASHCNRVTLATGTRGGFVTLAAMDDPGQALGEQFCQARIHAIEQGDSLAGTVQGFSMAEMQEQCEAFAPTMREYQARIATQTPGEAALALQDFVVATGAAPAQLSGNARICLGIGYRTDNAELALASAMVLVGLGEPAYGELIGHHLMQGFAVSRRADTGLDWLDGSTAALEAGAAPLVAVGGEGRAALIRAAIEASRDPGAVPERAQDAAAVEAGTGPFVLPRAGSD